MTDKPTADLRAEVTIQLQFPVTVDGAEYAELTIRRPKTKDSLAAEKVSGSNSERGLRLFARLCNVAPDVLEELDQFDMDTISAQFGAFTAR